MHLKNLGSLIAIFDIDGTLTKKDTFIPFFLRSLRNRPLRIFHTLILPFFIVLYYLKIINNHKLKEIFLYTVLSRAKVEDVEVIVYPFVDKLIKKGMNSIGMQLLANHQNRGDRILIASASFNLYVRNIANCLGVNEIVCSEAEIVDDRYTGRFNGLNCYGEEKLLRLKKYLGDIFPKKTIVYSDHLSDYPILQWADYGYLITPSKKCLQDQRSKEFLIIK